MDLAVMVESTPAIALGAIGDARPTDASVETTEATEVFAALLAALMTPPTPPTPKPTPTPTAVPAGVDEPMAVLPEAGIAVAVAPLTMPAATLAMPGALQAMPGASLAMQGAPLAMPGAPQEMPVPIAADVLPTLAAHPVPPADDPAAAAPVALQVSAVPLPAVAAASPADTAVPEAPTEVDAAGSAPAPATAAADTTSTGEGADTTPERDATPLAPLTGDVRPPVAAAATESVAPTVTTVPIATVAPRAADAAAAVTPTTPAAPAADPATQVVRAIAPLRKLGDGTHRVVLELRPADLGIVRVELSLASGVIHLGMSAEADATGELLRAALPGIRAQLDAAGLSAGRLSVAAGADGRSRAHAEWAAASSDADGRRRPTSDAGDQPAERHPSAYSSSSHGLVDVLL